MVRAGLTNLVLIDITPASNKTGARCYSKEG